MAIKYLSTKITLPKFSFQSAYSTKAQKKYWGGQKVHLCFSISRYRKPKRTFFGQPNTVQEGFNWIGGYEKCFQKCISPSKSSRENFWMQKIKISLIPVQLISSSRFPKPFISTTSQNHTCTPGPWPASDPRLNSARLNPDLCPSWPRDRGGTLRRQEIAAARHTSAQGFITHCLCAGLRHYLPADSKHQNVSNRGHTLPPGDPSRT